MRNRHRTGRMNRRDLLRLGGGLLVAGPLALRGTRASAAPLGGLQLPTCGSYSEDFPTSPFIRDPFTQDLPYPAPMKPSDPATWNNINSAINGVPWARPDCRTGGQQDYNGVVHQVGYEAIPVGTGTPNVTYLRYPEPLYYRLALQVGQHSFTSSRVLPIQSDGTPVVSGPGLGKTHLPLSTIYGFSTTPEIPNSCAFPGAMIYARYGQPLSLRLENQLEIDGGFNRNDFGSPYLGFLTHLHNGHTAAESDGNPHHRWQGHGGYLPGQWCDNLYLNFPPDNDPGEKQSFMWFHDHFMHHTGANVYKGMVGLYPIYDPIIDPGDERFGLHLPGRFSPEAEGRNLYDIPLAFFDVAIDDGVTGHEDMHNGCGEKHPEWWGKHFFRHYPNHGFVGDVFTTNCVAYPVLRVKRRKYRLRFLGASIARIYEFSIQTDGKVVPAGLDADGEAAYLANPGGFDFATAAWDSNPKKRQGQWRYRGGSQSHKLHQIAVEGGLLPFPIVRDRFEIWPAKRREFIVDFSRTLDGQGTYDGQVFYLVNTYQMTDGRKRTDQFEDDVDENGNPIQVPNPDWEGGFCVPMVKIIIDGNDMPVDNSVIPTKLRRQPRIPDATALALLPTNEFTLQRGSAFDPETEWIINGEEFDPATPLAFPQRGKPEVWTIRNGGGGWVHPMHFHFEEHRVLSREGIPTGLDPTHPDDGGREDVIALEPSEEVVMYRNFRTFTGNYVAHCHNLAHEDHNMMFGFRVVP